MKQVHANYTFNASTKTITLIGLNIAQDKLLLITNATRGVIYYNFASSSHRAVVTAGGDTIVVLTDASTTGHQNTDKLVIHYGDASPVQLVNAQGGYVYVDGGYLDDMPGWVSQGIDNARATNNWDVVRVTGMPSQFKNLEGIYQIQNPTGNSHPPIFGCP